MRELGLRASTNSIPFSVTDIYGTQDTKAFEATINNYVLLSNPEVDKTADKRSTVL